MSTVISRFLKFLFAISSFQGYNIIGRNKEGGETDEPVSHGFYTDGASESEDETV